MTKGDSPSATKEDIARIERSFLRLSEVVKETGQNIQLMGKRLYEADDQILIVLENIDKRLSGTVENHERRITRLEKVAA